MLPVMQANPADVIAHFMQVMNQSTGTLFSSLNPYILAPVFVSVLLLLIGYYRNYQFPANAIARALEKVSYAVYLARQTHKGAPDKLASVLDGIFALSPFKDLWAEYCSSLHTIEGAGGETAVLATAPAEAFFPREAVVDQHINADFYRHLPGILTGIGIIGTFSGLVWGLHQFNPAAKDAVASLPLLLQEVASAFVGSGFAILAAIFVTYKEKSALNRSYRAAAELNREIDGLYATGVGEEYLARLVAAVENNNAVQQKQTQVLAEHIAVAVREALAEPMQKLTAVVERATANQEEAVGDILQQVLTSFSAQLDEMFGNQIERVKASFADATEAMAQVRDSMTALLGDMASVGVSAVDQMSGTLSKAAENASAAQEKLNDQTRVFIDDIRDLLIRNQNQTAQAMDVTMRAVLVKLQGALTRLASDRAAQIADDKKRIAELTGAVAKLIASVDASAERTAHSINTLHSATGEVISGMNDGAAVMRQAADRFALAGHTLSVALEKSGALTETVEQMQELLASAVQLRQAV